MTFKETKGGEHMRRNEHEQAGFTLIELLVVIIIIGILAAIAIPVFLNQRKKGWDTAVKSDLRNAATAQETYITDSAAGVYTITKADLETNGFKPSANGNYATSYAVDFTIPVNYSTATPPVAG